MATILLVAAERMEFTGLVRRIGGERLDWPLDFARLARLPGRRLLVAANGAGPARAAEAVRVAAVREQFDLVASVGFCGSLDATLRAGEIVVADRVEALASGESFPTADRIVPHGGACRVCARLRHIHRRSHGH